MPVSLYGQCAEMDAITELLAKVAGTPFIETYNTSVYAQHRIQVEDRASIVAALKKADIPPAVHYPVSLTRQPALRNSEANVPHANAAAKRVLSLPMSPWLSSEDQDKIVSARSPWS
jgi:UDP-2-acetamido-2-deoxy-ribo-hexuluronate aminotransferase